MKEKDGKYKIIIIVNLLIVFVTLIIYSIRVSVLSIAEVLLKYESNNNFLIPNEILELNKLFNSSISISLSIFSIFELLYLSFYLFKNKKGMLLTIIVNIVVLLLMLFKIINLYLIDNDIIIFISLFNGLLYYISLRKKMKK